MNAVVALCHFCEVHGPSILFSTQAFHCTNHNPEDVLSGAQASLKACGNFNHSSLVAGLKLKSPNNENLKHHDEDKSGKTTPLPIQKTCEACTSIQQGDPGFLSIDKESHISYISRQYPEDQELYSILRHACVRSLSCEVCPGREGPIMFGDETSGYVFSHTFFLKDSQSRGFQRWYSLICVMMDHVYLMNSWPFLLNNFKSIIEELQKKCDATFKLEKAENPLVEQRLHMSANLSLLSPGQFRRTRGGNQKYRSLHELTCNPNIFQYVHRYFAWILKASGLRYCERFVQGSSVNDISIVEDGNQSTKHAESSVFSSLQQVFQILPSEDFKLIAYHVIIGDQLIVKGGSADAVTSFLDVFKALLPNGCCRIIPYTDEYQDSWKCNFLGLEEDVEIPHHILSSNFYVHVEIKKDISQLENNTISSPNDNLSALSIDVKGSPPQSMPTYLLKTLQALQEDEFSDSVLKAMLVSLKSEWMNKVKVMFQFTKAGVRTSADKIKLLKVLDAKQEDEILLKFWMTVLSRSYRTHLLTCANKKPVEKPSLLSAKNSDQLFFAVP
eukprot:gene15702-17286_t